ncbi:hypothetical protein ACOMHN_031128 [Nucella lapillus]
MMMTTTWGLNQRTLVVMWELVSTLWSLVDGCLPKELTATSTLRTLIYNGSSEPHCAWVIRGADRGDVIGMKIVDWITPSGFSCSRDRLIGHRWVDHPAAAVMEARVPGQWVDRPAAVVMEAREQGRCWIDHPAAA